MLAVNSGFGGDAIFGWAGDFFGYFISFGSAGELLFFSLSWLIAGILVLAVAWIVIGALLDAMREIKKVAADEKERDEELAEISAQPALFAAGDADNSAALRSLQNDGFQPRAAAVAMDATPAWDNYPHAVDMSGWSESGRPSGLERW